MTLDEIEAGVQWAGGAVALVTLLAIFAGIWRGAHRSAGRVVGRFPGWLRSPLFYLVTAAGFFGLCALLWKAIPLEFTPAMRIIALVLGSLICFPGLAFALWGRLTLGCMYFVSTSFGAELYSDHHLITHGPYAIIRHPMYAGLIAASCGGLFLYRTWAMIFIACTSFAVILRARREEQALRAEFEVEWQDYCQRVPGWVPRLKR